mmetsp:Transcript_15650/g.27696  ORF Transcript_15650/g.27696 Transcript_15650/m.27696 type:complete len:155 (+) Transcript_15650:296-760(+)
MVVKRSQQKGHANNKSSRANIFRRKRLYYKEKNLNRLENTIKRSKTARVLRVGNQEKRQRKKKKEEEKRWLHCPSPSRLPSPTHAQVGAAPASPPPPPPPGPEPPDRPRGTFRERSGAHQSPAAPPPPPCAACAWLPASPEAMPPKPMAAPSGW